MSSVDDRGDLSEFRNVVIGVGTFCRLRRLLVAAFVGEFCGERDGRSGEPNVPSRSRSMEDTGGG